MEYSKSRRMLMQGVMCLILCGSIALAALVTHERRGGARLAGMQYVDHVGVKLPAGWRLERIGTKPVLFVAREPDSPDKKGRQLTIERRTVDPALPAEEFLQSSGLLNGTLRMMPTADPGSNVADPIEIAGMPGIMLPVKKPIGGFLFMAPTGYETQLFAASVRPSGWAISLRLDCPDDSDPDGDVQTLRDIAMAMDVQDSASGR